jgi:hypothetical protein
MSTRSPNEHVAFSRVLLRPILVGRECEFLARIQNVKDRAQLVYFISHADRIKREAACLDEIATRKLSIDIQTNMRMESKCGRSAVIASAVGMVKKC